jgi:hypothetical protein
MIALKKPKATKCSDHLTITITIIIIIIIIAHTAKIVARILRRRIERMRLEKNSLDLEGEKELGMQLGC